MEVVIWSFLYFTNVTELYVHSLIRTRVYPKVSGLIVWSENGKWYSSCH
jgi:hypothetical protein